MLWNLRERSLPIRNQKLPILVSIVLTVTAWLGVFGAFDDVKTMLDVVDKMLSWMNHPAGRACFLGIASVCGVWLYWLVFGSVESHSRVLLDIVYRKPIRRWSFSDGTIENIGWSKTEGNSQRASLQTIDTIDAIPQARAVRVTAGEHAGIGTKVCDIKANMQATFGQDGCMMKGITGVYIFGDADVAEVALRTRT